MTTMSEGKDEKNWIKKQPEQLQPIWKMASQNKLKVSDFKWILNNKQEHPLEDVVDDVIKFKNQKIQQILKSNDLPYNLKQYKNANDLKLILSQIEQVEEGEIKYDEVLKDPSQVKFLKKVGNREILLALTQKGSISCDISGKDTTWCTTKRKGQNLFYSYIAKDIILFYIMDYSRTPQFKTKATKDQPEITEDTDMDSRLCVGFAKGKPILDGKAGGASVDAANNGLTERSLQKYFGDDYNEIMNLMYKEAEKIGTNHPAKETIKQAGTNILKLKKIIKNYGEEEKIDLFSVIVPKNRQNIIIPREKIDPRVLDYIIKSMEGFETKSIGINFFTKVTTDSIKELILMDCPQLHSSTIDFLVKKVIENPSEKLRGLTHNDTEVTLLARTNNISPNNIKGLINVFQGKHRWSDYKRFCKALAGNKNVSSDVLEDLYSEGWHTVQLRYNDAKEMYSAEGIKFLKNLRSLVLANPNVSADIVGKLNFSNVHQVIEYLKNTNANPEVLKQIFKKSLDNTTGNQQFLFFYGLARNKNTPHEIINQIIELQPTLGIQVLQNPSVPKEIVDLVYYKIPVEQRYEIAIERTINVYALSLFAKEEDVDDRALAAGRKELPIEIMKELVNDPSKEVREELLYNENVTNEILKILSQDEDDDIKTVAMQYLKQRGIQESFGRLAKKFKRLLK